MNIENDTIGIICTIGPATRSLEAIKNLIISGMTEVRINLSHATKEDIENIFSYVKIANEELKSDIKIALDTAGPELRIDFEEKEIEINLNDCIAITNEMFQKELKKEFIDKKITENRFLKSKVFNEKDSEYLNNLNYSKTPIFISNLKSFISLKINTTISIGDTNVSFEIIKTSEKFILLKCLENGKFKGKNKLTIKNYFFENILTKNDSELLNLGEKLGMSSIFVSYAQFEKDIKVFRKGYPNCKIIAKIETKLGVENIQSILECSDGIMIARGDLCLDVGVAKLYSTQEYICKCVAEFKDKKILIMATEMMSSMENNKYPTRAEISDVGSAVKKGCTSVMLSGETANGKYPFDTVKYMKEICLDAQKYVEYLKGVQKSNYKEFTFTTKFNSK